MAVCPKCGANNPVGRQSCRACGELLDESAEQMNTLRRTESGGPGLGDEAEATPEWLQLLLAKYGEETPILSLSPPAVLEAEPPVARPAVREIIGAEKRPSEGAEPEEIPDWLGSLGADRSVEEEKSPGARDRQPVEDEGSAESREADAAQVASWLSRLESVSPGHRTPAVAQPRAAAGDIPDWLAASLEQAEALEERQPDVSPAETPAVMKDNEEIPGWLARLGDVDASSAAGKPVPTGEVGGTPDERTHPFERDRLGALEPVKPSHPAIPEPGSVGEDSYEATELETPPIINTDELRARQAVATEESSAAPLPIRQEKEGVPNWLAQLISAQAEAPVEAPEQEPEKGAEEEYEAARTTGDALGTPERDAARALVEIPPWLAELNVSELEALEPEDRETPEIPVSLEEMDRESAGRLAEAESAPAEPRTVPPVVDTESTLAAVDGIRTPQVEQTAEGESLPDWLSHLRSLDDMGPAPSADVSPEVVEPAAVDVKAKDDWISDLEAMGTGAEAVPAGAEKPPAGKEGDVPEWFREMQAEIPGDEKAAESPVAEEAPVINHDLERAEIPQWMMKLKPETAQQGGGMEQVPGLPDVLPIAEDANDEETFASLRTRLAMPEVPDVEGASLFRKIASDAAESRPTAEEKPKESRLFATLVWLLVFLILIIAVAITLMAVLSRAENLFGALAFQEYLNSPGAVGLVGSVQGFRAQIAALPEESVVLVCFDYSPATEAEMGLLAEVIFDDLMQHQMRVVAVSLSPEGAMMAHRLIGRVSEQYPEGQAVNLGYLPGNAAGVRSLANLTELTTFEGAQRLPAISGWEGVDELADVAMAVDIADSNNTVRWWVEQQQVLGLADQPLLAAVSAASAPASRPYRETNLVDRGHLEELISGVTAAAAYEFYLGRPGRAMKGLAAQSVTHLGLLMVAVAGTIAGFRHQ